MLFTITAENADRYRARLTTGHPALFRLHPQTFRMNVYPTRRSVAHPEAGLTEVRKRAAFAQAAAFRSRV